MIIKNKRGELTTTQLVTIIILIVSFVIILFLIFRLNLGKTTDTEICHNSVVLGGQSPFPSGPLDCKTQYVCISGGGDCQNFSSTEKISVDSANKNETMKALADKMAECWYEFGEGKIDYADSKKPAYTTCALCSNLNFDQTLQQSKKISYSEFYTYLKNTKKTESQTYLQYLYGTDNTDFLSSSYLGNSIEFNKTYSILTGIKNEGWWSYMLSRDISQIFLRSQSQPVTIIENTPENYQQVSCDEFLTKA